MSDVAMKMIEVADCTPSKTNPRKYFDKTKMEELVASVKAKGVLQNIIVRPVKNGQTKFEIVCGERRYRAAKAAKLDLIPAAIHELSDQEVVEFQLIENLDRQDIHPLEEAAGYARLMKDYAYSVEDIAVKIGNGRTPAHIYGRLKLESLPKPVKDAFWAGDILPSIALLIARIPNPKAAEEAASDIMKGGPWADGKASCMTYRTAQKYIQERYMLRLTGAPFDTEDVKLIPAAGSCVACPKRTGNQLYLFEDIGSKDVCTDPPCYREKVEAAFKSDVVKAKEKGQTVLTEKEAKEVFAYQDRLGHNSLYVKITDACEDDPKGRTWSALLKKHLPATILAKAPETGKTHLLIPKKEAYAALKEAGHKFKVSKSPSSSNPDIRKHQEQEKKRKFQQFLRIEAIGEVVEDVHAGVTNFSMGIHRALVRLAIGRASSDCLRILMKRRGWDKEVKEGPVHEVNRRRESFLRKKVEEGGSGARFLHGLMTELILIPEILSAYSDPGVDFNQIMRLYNVDLKTIEKRVLEGSQAKKETKKKVKNAKRK